MKIAWVRIITDICIFIGVLTLPWWLSVMLLMACIIYFPLYIEALFLAFLFDTLYATQYEFPQIGLLIATMILLITMFVRTRIRN